MGDYFNATEIRLENNNPFIVSGECIGTRIDAKRPIDSV